MRSPILSLPAAILTSLVMTLAPALLAPVSAFAAMTECQTHCETTHKYCISDKKMSQRACLAQLEKCRQTCDKKAQKDLVK